MALITLRFKQNKYELNIEQITFISQICLSEIDMHHKYHKYYIVCTKVGKDGYQSVSTLPTEIDISETSTLYA